MTDGTSAMRSARRLDGATSNSTRAAQVVEYGRRRYVGYDAASSHLPAHVDPRYPFEHVRIGLLFSDELREERRARLVERHSAGLTALRLSDSDMVLVDVGSGERRLHKPPFAESVACMDSSN